MTSLLARCALLALTAALPACASSGAARETRGPSVAPALTEQDMAKARQTPVVRGDGGAASWTELVETCGRADAVIVAERHGFKPGLAGAAALWSSLVDFIDGQGIATRPALALEFWERDHQVQLDDYLAGITDEAGLVSAMGWTGARADQSFPPGHRAMVNSAKAKQLPVIAANAPRRYVRLARLEGYERLLNLNERQRALFRIPTRLIEGRYRDDFERIMGGDPVNPTHDAMFRSQQVWDWTMADSLARAIDAGHRPVVLVVGAFHAEHDGGLNQALRELRPGTRVVTVSFLDSKETETPLGAAAAAPDPVDRGPRADFVIDFAR